MNTWSVKKGVRGYIYDYPTKLSQRAYIFSLFSIFFFVGRLQGKRLEKWAQKMNE